MTNYHWIKLYDEILDDPKMGRLSDGAYRLCINLFLQANRSEERDGRLPGLEDMAWIFRLSMDDLQSYWQELEQAEIVCMVDDLPYVRQFKSRQEKPVSVADRVAAHRARKQQENGTGNENETELDPDSNEYVTQRYQNKEEDTEKEEEKTISSALADYQAIRLRWIELFPAKPKPRATNKTLTGKARTRMRQKHFRENWCDALTRASQSAFLHSSSWFDLGWFLKNDDHYDRCLIGKYDDGPKSSNGRMTPAPAEERVGGAY